MTEDELLANQKVILANQETILANQKRSRLIKISSTKS